MHSTTGNKIMTTTSQNKSPLLKTKTSPSVATISNATIVSKSDSLEIEEISKKISEHADALYRTWKNRGLVPPAEILEFYTVEAAQAAGASKEELQSTEGLQKLVNTFVIKDKEQRGKVKKTATIKTAATTPTTTATSNNTEVKTSTTTTAVTIKNQLSDHVTATTSLSSNSKMPSSSSSSSSSLVSPISQNALTSTTSTLIFNNSKQAISSRVASLQKQQQQHLKLDDHQYSQQSKQQKPQHQQQLSQNLQQQLLYPQQLKLEQKQLKYNQQTQQQKQQQMQPSIHSQQQQQQQQQQQVKHNQLLQQQKGQHMPQNVQQQLKAPQYQEHQQQKSYLQLKQPLQPLQQQQQQQTPMRSQLHVHEPQNQYQSEIGQKITSSKIKLNTKSSKPSTDIIDSVTKSATNLNGNTKKFMMNTAPHVTTKVPVSSQATAHLEKNLNFDIDLDLKLDLNLDVKQLSEMQNQNLRKIKDFINQSNAKIPTKIPTLTINTNNSNQGRGGAGVEHSIKMKTSAKVTNIITAPLIDDLRQRLKHDDGNDDETTIREVNFLTRGSVAERVLMFEKCPDVRNAFLNIKRPDKVDTPPKVQKSFAIDNSEDQYRQDYPTLYKVLEGQETLFQRQWPWKA
uniref:Uncharacterized protein n=1 Tax=Glossina austeni TaxID=7395 RepID=A0A1A9VVY5_GLOAU